ncbi:MAG: hypothetical protein HOB26_05790 [Flavobacteriales bacterium]|nr:hypothetical protein [Flavobacteriales bacterium]
MLVYHGLDRRRIVRDFLDRPVSKELLENIIKATSTIPISTHQQSWTFVRPLLRRQNVRFERALQTILARFLLCLDYLQRATHVRLPIPQYNALNLL